MSRFLVTAAGPLIDEPGTRVVSGQCLRAIHFVRPMIEAGHEVDLLTVPIPGTESADAKKPLRKRTYRGEFAYKAFTTNDETRILPVLKKRLAREKYDAVVGLNAYPAYLLAAAGPTVPFWADLYGWTMAEGQSRSALVGHDRDQDHFWRLEAAVLLAADRFSTVSVRQGDALYGELAMTGRLNSLTFTWPFAYPVPTAVDPRYSEMQRNGELPAALGSLSENTHVVLWSGGFNTWTDVDLLANALARALEERPEMHFVATGGAVVGHNDTSFRRFRELAREKLPRKRYALLGWVDTDLVLALHASASLGLCVDSLNTETRFGARTRLTNMMGAGLPVLTTRGTEIAEWIERREAGGVVPSGDAEALANALIDSAGNKDKWFERADRARAMALEDFSPTKTLEEFLNWCAAPQFAPDRGPAAANDARLREVQQLESRLWTQLKVDRQVGPLLMDRASLHNLRRKLPLRLWYWLKQRVGSK